MPAFLAFAVIPFGPEVTIPFTDTDTPLQLTDMPVGVLFILAVSSIGIYGIVLGGWSSGSTYSLLGGLRSSAQMISYEVAMGLALVAVFLYAGSMSTSEIVAAQERLWFGVILFPSFVIYVIAMVGETNRAPFDLAEAEGELVGGFHTEYSSLKFALFFLAEYVNMVTVSALATTLFLGGWRAPWPISAINDGMSTGLLAVPVVHRQGDDLHLRLHLAARYAAAAALRPVHEVRLEGPDPGLAASGSSRSPRSALISLDGGVDRTLPARSRIGVVAVLFLVLFFVGERGASRRGRGRPRTSRSLRRLRRRLPGAADARHQAHRPYRRRADRRPSTATADGKRELMPTLKEQFWDPVAGFGVTFRTMFRRSSPSSTRSRRSRPRRASTAGTSSTAGPTAWRSASAASCAPGPAPPTRSTSRAPPTPRTSASRPASATAASTRSTTCAASCAGCASRRARPGR